MFLQSVILALKLTKLMGCDHSRLMRFLFGEDFWNMSGSFRFSMAVDWINKLVYFTSDTNSIEVVDYNGTNRRALIWTGLSAPRYIQYPLIVFIIPVSWTKIHINL